MTDRIGYTSTVEWQKIVVWRAPDGSIGRIEGVPVEHNHTLDDRPLMPHHPMLPRVAEFLAISDEMTAVVMEKSNFLLLADALDELAKQMSEKAAANMRLFAFLVRGQVNGEPPT